MCFLQKQLVLRPEPANPVSPLPPYFFPFRSFVQNKMPLCQIKMNDLVVYIHVNCSFTKLKPELTSLGYLIPTEQLRFSLKKNPPYKLLNSQYAEHDRYKYVRVPEGMTYSKVSLNFFKAIVANLTC